MDNTLDTVKIRLHRFWNQLKDEFKTRCEYYWVSELGGAYRKDVSFFSLSPSVWVERR